jgi:hypothetical protein
MHEWRAEGGEKLSHATSPSMLLVCCCAGSDVCHAQNGVYGYISVGQTADTGPTARLLSATVSEQLISTAKCTM